MSKFIYDMISALNNINASLCWYYYWQNICIPLTEDNKNPWMTLLFLFVIIVWTGSWWKIATGAVLPFDDFHSCLVQMQCLQLYLPQNSLTRGQLIQFAALYWCVQYCWPVKNDTSSNGFYMNIAVLSLILDPALEDYTISLWWWDHCCGRWFNSKGTGYRETELNQIGGNWCR